MLSPKQSRNGTPLFPYYAGFSPHFVASALQAHYSGHGPVLDPWNGAGTTTAVASALGIPSIGVDLNPFMTIVAAAREQPVEIWEGLLANIPARWKASRDRTGVLQTWLNPGSCGRVRGFERALWMVVGGDQRTYAYDLTKGQIALSGRQYAAALVAALVVRRAVADFHTSNPTWIRIRVDSKDRVDISKAELRRIAERVLKDIIKRVRGAPENRHLKLGRKRKASLLRVGDSGELPFSDGQFHTVLCSPPYCTRIDYVVATLPELAAIGVPGWYEITPLRKKMLGTPNWGEKDDKVPVDEFPTSIKQFLSRVAAHESKAAGSYYLRYYRSYFSRLSRSFGGVIGCSRWLA